MDYGTEKVVEAIDPKSGVETVRAAEYIVGKDIDFRVIVEAYSVIRHIAGDEYIYSRQSVTPLARLGLLGAMTGSPIADLELIEIFEGACLDIAGGFIRNRKLSYAKDGSVTYSFYLGDYTKVVIKNRGDLFGLPAAVTIHLQGDLEERWHHLDFCPTHIDEDWPNEEGISEEEREERIAWIKEYHEEHGYECSCDPPVLVTVNGELTDAHDYGWKEELADLFALADFEMEQLNKKMREPLVLS